MKNSTVLVFCFFFITFTLQAQDQRIAYSYLSANVEKAIPETMDKDELTTKEKKLFEKFMKRMNSKTITYFENYLREKLGEKGYNVLPLNTVGVMSKSALNLDGYPFIFFPKKTLKKNADKDLSDHFISASVSVNKPITALVGMKPTVIVSLKLFSKSGEVLQKVNASHKTEKKVSNLGFVAKEKERFSKIDMEHAEILFSQIQETISISVDDAISQLN